MTKSRKIGISLAFALIFILLCACVIPACVSNNRNVANAVTVQTRDEWVNPYNGTYYNNLNTNQTGEAFRKDLAKLITHTNNPSYDGLKEIFKTTDADPDNKGNVIWFYTGDSIPYTGAMDSGNYRTNREHVWPKMGGSAFPETSEAGSDAHHLRPLNTKLNNTRSNYHFGEVSQSESNRVLQDGPLANYGTSDPDTWCYLSGGYFYPAKGYRGATARILFYVQTRWGDTSNLSFTLGSGSAKVMSNVDILLKWHLQEPPTDEEIRRNEAVYGIQRNRNPFIDHPEYAEMIYCHDGKSYNSVLQNVVATYGGYLNGNVTPPTPTLTGLTLSPNSLSLTVGATQTISVTATPSTASNSVTWTTSDGNVATVSNSGVVTAVGAGAATITAISTVDTSIKASLTVSVVSSENMRGVFESKMSELANAKTLEEKYNAIYEAINAFKQMPQADQNACAAEKAKLLQAIDDYNAAINLQNSEFKEATNFASQALAMTLSTAFLALVLIVVKQTVGR